jgi:ABC-2 type transport system permease protein
VVVLFAGVAFLVLGAAPRLTVGLTIGLAALTYVVQLVGPMLEWPSYLVGLSPFHHLAPVPAEPYALVAGLVMAGLGVLATLLGMAAFERRDLAGA